MIYISSPYTHANPEVVEARVDAAMHWVVKAFSETSFAISPIVHCHPIAMIGGLRGDLETWQEWNMRLMDGCTQMDLLMLPGWKRSIGVHFEWGYFSASHKPINPISWSTIQHHLPKHLIEVLESS